MSYLNLRPNFTSLVLLSYTSITNSINQKDSHTTQVFQLPHMGKRERESVKEAHRDLDRERQSTKKESYKD